MAWKALAEEVNDLRVQLGLAYDKIGYSAEEKAGLFSKARSTIEVTISELRDSAFSEVAKMEAEVQKLPVQIVDIHHRLSPSSVYEFVRR
jgi:hypothetical protein